MGRRVEAPLGVEAPLKTVFVHVFVSIKYKKLAMLDGRLAFNNFFCNLDKIILLTALLRSIIPQHTFNPSEFDP